MKALWPALLSCAHAFAAVSGTVVNGSSGALVKGAVVTLAAPGGKDAVATATTDALGRFRIDREPEGVLRTVFDGIVYEVPTAGSPSLVVYRASKERGPARVRNHAVRFEPTAGGLAVYETFEYVNEGTTTWNDPSAAALRFYVPREADGKVDIRVAGQTARGDRDGNIYSLRFPVRPGETRIEISYSLRFQGGAVYHGEILTEPPTLLSASGGLELAGAGLRKAGQDYLVTSKAYDVMLKRTAAPQPAPATDDEGPTIEQILPRIYSRAPALVALMLAVLALGFARLCRIE